ncbi:MAG: YheC/YheD family protein [Paenisporosarcina sp.]
MKNVKKLKKRTIKSGVDVDSFMIGVLGARSNKKLKKHLHNLKDLGDTYKNGKLGVFSLKGINRNKQTIKGYLYNDGKWKLATFSMPHAVINRISLNKKWERFFRRTLGNRMVNNFTFNKWDMYERLSKHPSLDKHLPVTRFVNGPQDIFGFLGQHNEGYIKPINGTKGKGVFKVSKHEQVYKVETSLKDPNDALYLNHEELEEFFTTKCKKRKYIIQQAIDINVGKRPMDFRLIMIKDGEGVWRDLGIVAKKGRKNGIVSSGEEEISGNTILNLLSNPRFEVIKIREQMTRISLNAAKEMEKHGGFNGNLGNLGFDLGLDRNQNLWIIEINNRNPDHRIAFDVGDEETYMNSNKLLIDYCLHLIRKEV